MYSSYLFINKKKRYFTAYYILRKLLQKYSIIKTEKLDELKSNITPEIISKEMSNIQNKTLTETQCNIISEILPKPIIKIRSRSSIVFQELLNSDYIIAIYNGRKYVPIYLTNICIGHKLGEFVPTRFFSKYKEKELPIE